MGSSGRVAAFRSALSRPLDRRYPTNLAVLILAPIAGLITGGLALWQGRPTLTVLEAAVGGSLAAFAGWALARELAPDDNAAAFVCLGLTFLAGLLFPSSSILVVFTALMLARVVNRSVGVPATILDSVAVTLLVGWTVYGTRNAAPAAVAAVALSLDAFLPWPLRRQLVFAGICGAGGLAFLLKSGHAAPAEEAGSATYLPVVSIALIYALNLFRTRAVHSVADLTGERLIVSRVRAGMAVGWLMAVQGALVGARGLAHSSLIWAVLAGLVLTAFCRLFPGTSR